MKFPKIFNFYRGDYGRDTYGFGGDRNVTKQTGRKASMGITNELMLEKVKSDGIAHRVATQAPNGTWEKPPQIVSEDSQEFFDNLIDKNAIEKMKRADILASCQDFSLLILGFDDGRSMSMNVESASELLYIRPVPAKNVEIKSYYKDTQNPKYGMPEIYRVKFQDSNNRTTNQVEIHESRILHISHDNLDSDLVGTPNLRLAFNLIEDLEKITAGGAEIYWDNASGNIVFNGPKPKDENKAEKMKKLLDKFSLNLKKYLFLSNVEAKVLQRDFQDPTNFADFFLSLIAITINSPQRIFKGNEAGELASSQDSTMWEKFLISRRRTVAADMFFRPLLDKMIEVGVLAEDMEYEIKIENTIELSEKDKIENAKNATEALNKLMSSLGAESVVDIEEFVKDLGLPLEQDPEGSEL